MRGTPRPPCEWARLREGAQMLAVRHQRPRNPSLERFATSFALLVQGSDMDDRITPAELAREFDVDQRLVRRFLRAEFGKLVAPETRWHLDEEQAERTRSYFQSTR